MPSSLAFSTDPGLKLMALLICICSLSVCVRVCVHAPHSLRFRELFGLCFLRPANVSFHVVGPRMANAKSTNTSLATPYLALRLVCCMCVMWPDSGNSTLHTHTPSPYILLYVLQCIRLHVVPVAFTFPTFLSIQEYFSCIDPSVR